jgi:UDP-N-acetylmuramoylalanine--D-glutamate ligase
MNLKNKKIAILGLGVEGLSSAVYLHQKGADVTVLDEKPEGEIDTASLQTIKQLGVHTVLGKSAFENLPDYEMLVRTPGIRRFTKPLDDAASKGVIVTSQTKLFFDMCPCPIIGVTGTKGKGTTSSLIYEMLKKDGRDAYLGGNIGKPPFEFLDELTKDSIVVLEMSSYQLQDMDKSPHIAVMLMVTSEHLAPDRSGSLQNYHPDIADYVDAKRNIVRFQTKADFAILNRDYPATNESDIYTDAQIYYVSREREVAQGCFVKNGKIVIRQAGYDEQIINTAQILLPGKHNWENVCAAVMAATVTGVQKGAIIAALKTFRGLEHRLELVREVNGVKYYDDSFATTPETAIAAIEAFKEPEILILGGSTKNADFTELGKVIDNAKNIKAIIGIGVEWERIKERIKNQESRIKIIEGCKDMREIIGECSGISESGDVVLLSPACASFGMFQNYKDRGEQFKREVKKLSY